MKNKTKLLVALALMIITLASISYAAFFVSKNQTNDNKVLSGCFDTTLTENSASINMTKALPLTNEQGLNTNPYSFTISNTCTINADYTVLLNVKNNSFSDEYISYNYSGNEVNTLNTASLSSTVPVGFTKSYILGTGTLKRGKSETINIKLWLNELADYQSMLNHTFEAEIQIVSRVSTNQTYGDVTLAYTVNGESTNLTYNELIDNYDADSISCSEGNATLLSPNTGISVNYTMLPAACTINFVEYSCNIEPNTVLLDTETVEQSSFNATCPGKYKLEVWGASGNGNQKGYGGYSIGVVKLKRGETVTAYIGGTDATNGGGTTIGNYSYQKGGGATHIATVSGTLKSLESYRGNLSSTNDYYISDKILIVAGGGGGNWSSYRGGSGGGYQGGSSQLGGGTASGIADGGTQLSPGCFNNYTNATLTSTVCSNDSRVGGFGLGGNTSNEASGGGGFYGGAGANSGNGGSAGGGSGYIASSRLISSNGITKHMYCYNCGTRQTNTEYATEVGECYNSTATPDCAKDGNGHARITYLGK